MKKLFLALFIFSNIPAAQEHKHQPRPIHRSPEVEFNNDIHLTIDVPERPVAPEPRTPQDIKRLKIKLVALTAILTAIITGGVSVWISLNQCKG